MIILKIRGTEIHDWNDLVWHPTEHDNYLKDTMNSVIDKHLGVIEDHFYDDINSHDDYFNVY